METRSCQNKGKSKYCMGDFEITPDDFTFYEKIKRWAKDSAVVPVKKQACYGCYMKINDKNLTKQKLKIRL